MSHNKEDDLNQKETEFIELLNKKLAKNQAGVSNNLLDF